MKVNFETSNGRFLLIKFKDNQSDFRLTKYKTHAVIDYEESLNGTSFKASENIGGLNIELLNCSIIGLVKDLTEEKLEEVVDSASTPFEEQKLYRNYKSDTFYNSYITAKRSGQSLIESLNIKEGNWLLIKYL